jgi:hypothetical protein
MTRAALVATCLLFVACGPTTPAGDAGVCSAFTCRGCCDATGACRTGAEPTACGVNGFTCVDCAATGQTCGGGACFSATGGGGGATGGGGGSTGGGGGSIGGGGGSTGGGGGSTGGGGGSIGGGGGSTGGGGGSTGGGGGGSTGGGGGSTGGGGGSIGGGGGATGGGGGATGGGGGATGGGGGATGGGGGSTGGGGGATCTPENDVTFCYRNNAECDALTAADNCGAMRTVSCGTCSALEICGAQSRNTCGLPRVTLSQEVVAPDGRGTSDATIRYDGAGFLHAFYVDLFEGDVFHAWRDSSGWRREPVADAQTARVLIIDARWDSGGTPRLLLLFITDATTTTTYEYRLYTRGSSGTWTRATLTLPANATSPGSSVRLEGDGAPVVLTRESSGQPHPNNCRAVLQRQSGSAWTSSVIGTWGSYNPCTQTGLGWTFDANGRSVISLAGVDNGQRWSTIVENPAGTWTRSPTPMSSNDALLEGRIAVGADGTIHLLGTSAVSGQASRYMFGSGSFWSEETVTGLQASGAPQRLDLFGADVLFSRVTDDQRVTTSGTVKRLSVSRVQRAGPNSYTALPSRAFDQDLGIPATDSLSRTYKGLDPSREPVLLTKRQRFALGDGLDLTDWPSGVQRTVELDWAEGSVPLDLAYDASGAPHALLSMGEYSYGQARLVVRSRTASGWVESQPVLPDGFGNGNGHRAGRLRLHPVTGRKVVLVMGALATGTSALVLATEETNGSWTREEVVRPTSTVGGFDLFITPTGGLHVAYAMSNNLSYATRGASSWTVETAITATGTAGARPRLVVDAAGTPCLGYVTGSGYDLAFARRASGTWQAASFYDGNGHGFGLELDGQGRACFLHVPLGTSGGYELTTRCLVGSTLQATVVSGSNLDIVGTGRDAQGRFRLYGEEAFWPSPSLYAQTASGWTREQLVDDWTYGERPPFAVAPSGAVGFLISRGDTRQRVLWRHQ